MKTRTASLLVDLDLVTECQRKDNENRNWQLTFQIRTCEWQPRPLEWKPELTAYLSTQTSWLAVEAKTKKLKNWAASLLVNSDFMTGRRGQDNEKPLLAAYVPNPTLWMATKAIEMKNRTASLLVDSDLVCECPSRNKGESDCQFNRRLRRHRDQMPSLSQEGECMFTCQLEPFDGMPNARKCVSNPLFLSEKCSKRDVWNYYGAFWSTK